jgi:hypothetical protein
MVICVWFCRIKDGKKSLVFNTEGKYTMAKCSIKTFAAFKEATAEKIILLVQDIAG